ncbi:MAG: LicD family protein [Rikenellaceae bacterium]
MANQEEKIGGYTRQEIDALHRHLYRILDDIVAVCDKLGIKYFLIGGSAMGAHFEGEILPWDDDIDIGMERADYNRFVSEAQEHLPSDLFVQSPYSEARTPHYFTKVRLNGSIFEDSFELDLPIHHGIFVDVFPLDVVPSCSFIERLHRLKTRILTNVFAAKNGGRYAKLSSRIIYGFLSLFAPRFLLKWALKVVPSAFNTSCSSDKKSCRLNIISQPRDHIKFATVNPPQVVKFGAGKYKAPHDLEGYLNHHYRNLRPTLPREEWVNHYPVRLQFPE